VITHPPDVTAGLVPRRHTTSRTRENRKKIL